MPIIFTQYLITPTKINNNFLNFISFNIQLTFKFPWVSKNIFYNVLFWQPGSSQG